MNRKCKNCGDEIYYRVIINGRERNLQNRKYCLKCSPFGSGGIHKNDNLKSNKSKKERNKEKYKKWQQKARKERKEKLVKILGGKCFKCGYDKYVGALDFHHIKQEDKKFGISSHGLCRKWDELVEEVKKCILLCKNCHTELHGSQ